MNVLLPDLTREWLLWSHTGGQGPHEEEMKISLKVKHFENWLLSLQSTSAQGGDGQRLERFGVEVKTQPLSLAPTWIPSIWLDRHRNQFSHSSTAPAGAALQTLRLAVKPLSCDRLATRLKSVMWNNEISAVTFLHMILHWAYKPKIYDLEYQESF